MLTSVCPLLHAVCNAESPYSPFESGRIFFLTSVISLKQVRHGDRVFHCGCIAGAEVFMIPRNAVASQMKCTFSRTLGTPDVSPCGYRGLHHCCSMTRVVPSVHFVKGGLVRKEVCRCILNEQRHKHEAMGNYSQHFTASISPLAAKHTSAFHSTAHKWGYQSWEAILFSLPFSRTETSKMMRNPMGDMKFFISRGIIDAILAYATSTPALPHQKLERQSLSSSHSSQLTHSRLTE